MTATPPTGHSGGRRRQYAGRDGYRPPPYQSVESDPLAVIYERMDATDDVLKTMSAQMGEAVRQLNVQSGAIQVLTTNDSNLKAQLDGHAAELREWRDWRLQFMTQFGQMQASLESKIQQAVTSALKDTQDTERQSNASRFTDARNLQQWLVTALITLLGIGATYLLTTHH